MVESVIVMLLFCLVLFGLLQVIYVYAAQMIADYSAFNAVRSGSVGFRSELVERAGRTAAIGASGRLLAGNGDYDPTSPISMFGVELLMIPKYVTGEIYWLNYQHTGRLSVEDHGSGMGMRKADVSFQDYPFEFPMWGAFSKKKGLDLDAEAEMADHAAVYLEY